MKIWLDDERTPPDEKWIWVDTASKAIDLLLQFDVAMISLDHDLGDEKEFGNGYQVILSIEERVHVDDKYAPPVILIHTQNPVARQKMVAARNSIEKRWSR